jgi:hypothetical protein
VKNRRETAAVTSSSGSVAWSITTVYGPQSDSDKLQFLGELRWVKLNVLEKWIVLGDFNMILKRTRVILT